MNRDNQPNRTDRYLPANFLAWLATIMLVVGSIAFIFLLSAHRQPAVAAGEVKTLLVRGDWLTATKTDGSKLKARKEPDISALEALRVLGVQAEALADLRVIIEEEEAAPGFSFMNFTSFLIIVALLGLLVFRNLRPTPGNNSLYSPGQMGRSNPRVISGETNKNGRDNSSKNPVKFNTFWMGLINGPKISLLLSMANS